MWILGSGRPARVAAAVAMGVALLVGIPQRTAAARPAASTSTVGGLHVVGNELLNAAGQAVVLRGVDRSGTEYACVQGWGIFSGPSDAASIRAIAAWHVNAVRVPLNEDCWLSLNGVAPNYGGTAYRRAISTYVSLLNRQGMTVILDLHWSAPGGRSAQDQAPMPDQDHSIAFWQSVATTFKGNRSVLFDLFNEPYPDSNQDSSAAWICWRDGGACPGINYPVAGMQTLVSAVRATGAPNVILLGGVQYANSLSQWLTYAPRDPLHNLAASWHSYNGQQCAARSCWNAVVAPVIAQVPLVAGEIGEDDCASGFITRLMNWLDGRHASYLAWSWNVTDDGICHVGQGSSIALLKQYSGAPLSGFGRGYRDHLARVASTADASPAPSATPS
jgi:endoglucanase